MILEESGYIENFRIDEADLRRLETMKIFFPGQSEGLKECHNDEVFGRLFPRVEDIDECFKKNRGEDYNISDYYILPPEYYIECCVRDRCNWDKKISLSYLKKPFSKGYSKGIIRRGVIRPTA